MVRGMILDAPGYTKRRVSGGETCVEDGGKGNE